jgi:hypothetical protein
MPKRPKLVRPSEETKQIAALLERELMQWPDVSVRPMFGMHAVYHGAAIFEEAPLYEEAIRRGAVIALAKVDERMEPEAVATMGQHGARDIHDVADTWRASGWSGPSSDPHAYVSDSSVVWHEIPERAK